MLAVKINNLSHSINNQKVLQNINLELEKDKIACILGPSGCGKTTLLKLIAGLEKVTTGDIIINDEIVSSNTMHLKTEKRKIAEKIQFIRKHEKYRLTVSMNGHQFFKEKLSMGKLGAELITILKDV